MNEIMPMLEQVRSLMVQNAPVDAWAKTLPTLGVLLVLGIGICVFGAKLAKFAVAGACGLVGATLGAQMAREGGLAVPPCAVVAGAMLAVVGYLTFRLWVGVITAGVVVLVALFVFGHEKLGPHLAEFGQKESALVQPAPVGLPGTATANVPLVTSDFVPPVLPVTEQTVTQFWSFLRERDAALAAQSKVITVSAALAGLFLGVVLVRVMLILSTSLIGTGLTVFAGIGILASVYPNGLTSIQGNPSVSAVGLGGLLITSLIVQALLTRGGARATEPSGKAKS